MHRAETKQVFCVLCCDIGKRNYAITLENKALNIKVKGFLCSRCFEDLIRKAEFSLC